MGTKKQQQNIQMAKMISDIHFSGDSRSKYTRFVIDKKMAELASIDAMNPNNSLENVPDEIRNDKDFPSYVIIFEHTRRLLKVQKDLYEMGKDYFIRGIPIEESPLNYKNNEYFIAGYNDAKNNNLSDSSDAPSYKR